MHVHEQVDDSLEDEHQIRECIKELAYPLNALLERNSRRAVAIALSTHLSCALEAMLSDGSSGSADVETYIQELRACVLEQTRPDFAEVFTTVRQGMLAKRDGVARHCLGEPARKRRGRL